MAQAGTKPGGARRALTHNETHFPLFSPQKYHWYINTTFNSFSFKTHFKYVGGHKYSLYYPYIEQTSPLERVYHII